MPQDAFAALQDCGGFRVSGDRLGSSSKNCALVGGAVYGASSISQNPAHFPEPKGNKRRRADSGPKPREPQGIRCAYRHRIVHLLSAQRAPAFLGGQHSRFWLCGVTFLLKCAASSPKCILFRWKRRGSYGRIKSNYIVLLGRQKRGTEDVYCHLRRLGKGTGGLGKPAVCLAEGTPTPGPGEDLPQRCGPFGRSPAGKFYTVFAGRADARYERHGSRQGDPPVRCSSGAGLSDRHPHVCL